MSNNQENNNSVHEIQNNESIRPENRADIIPYDESEYQTSLVNNTVSIYHDKDTVSDVRLTGETFVLYEIPQTIGNALHDRLLFQDLNDFDVDWYIKCREYVDSLTRAEKYILRRYTRHGDEIVNKYIRDKDNFDTDERVKELLQRMEDEGRYMFAAQILRNQYPNSIDYINEYFTDHGELYISEDTRDFYEFVESNRQYVHEMIEDYIEDLSYILRSAPRLHKEIRVFRGVKEDYMYDKVEQSAVLKGFVSTTLDPQIMATFGRKNVHEIIVGSGTPCLPMNLITVYKGENEILLDYNLYAIAYYKNEKFMLNEGKYYGNFDARVLLNPSYARNNPLPEFYSRLLVIQGEDLEESPAQGGRSTVMTTSDAVQIHKTPSNYKQKLTRSNKTARKSVRYTIRNRRGMKPSFRIKIDDNEPFWKVRANADPILVDKPVPKHIDTRLRSILSKYILQN